ncbi:hypothetical protein DOY81_004801 [Sarcophaga bullata]|nr:hypothetical protein DOY81_004801 [Sarcophaga bullata]
MTTTTIKKITQQLYGLCCSNATVLPNSVEQAYCKHAGNVLTAEN